MPPFSGGHPLDLRMSPMEPVLARRQKSWLDRSLALFTDVQPGEGLTALLLAANVFCLLAFYSVLKVVRDALILADGDGRLASYAAAGQALVLLAAVPAYGVFASRVNRLRLICGVTIFFATHLLLFYILGAAGARIGFAFYLWAGVFNLMVIAQFWGFANDIYSSERGKRLFPIVGVGASLGALAGSGLTYLGFREIGPYVLMLVAAVGLVLTLAFTLWVNARERTAIDEGRASTAEKPLGKEGGFQLVLRQRYLLLIALLVVAVNLVNTLGNFLLYNIIDMQAEAAVASGTAQSVEDVAGTMSAAVQTWVNLLGLIFQAFLVSRIFKYLGVRSAILILPIVALSGYSAVALVPVATVIMGAKILENSSDYSIWNTTRNALFLPTTREAKYKAKQAIDSFFWRAGDLLQAGVVYAGTELLILSLRHFALLNVAFASLMLAIAVALYREHRKLTTAVADEQAA